MSLLRKRYKSRLGNATLRLCNKLPLDALAMFKQVVESGSFTAAAGKLGVPTSTVTRATTRLEQALKTRLVHRRARGFVLSEAGKQLYDESSPHLAALAELSKVVRSGADQPEGALRITGPADMAESIVGDLLVRFTAQYPRITIDVDLTPRLVDIIGEGFDVALRATTKLPDDDRLVGRRLIGTEVQCFASPTYVARRGELGDPDELAEHDCVLFRAKDGRSRWEMQSAGESRAVEVSGRICANDFSFVRDLVRAGAGIGAFPALLARDDLASGRLVRVLPGWSRRAGTLYVMYAGDKHLPKKVAAFRDFAVAHFRGVPQAAAR